MDHDGTVGILLIAVARPFLLDREVMMNPQMRTLVDKTPELREMLSDQTFMVQSPIFTARLDLQNSLSTLSQSSPK